MKTMFYKRQKYLDQLYKYIKTDKLIVLYGARQVGKTTLLKILLDDSDLNISKKYVNIDDIYEKTFKTKDEFINYIGFNYGVDFFSEGLLFLDEVQSLPNIEQILKSLYDDDKIKLKIIATGSGLWHIEKLGSSLVGRIKQIWVYPFSFYEFLDYKGININYLNFKKYNETIFDSIKYLLEEYYIYGGYPAVITEKTKEDKILKISEIIDVYLKKDVQYFIKGNDLVNFKKILTFLAGNISSLLNINELSNYLGISREKVEYQIEILEKSFLLYKVYPFYSNTRKEYSKQPEYFLNDLGLINYFKNDFNFIDFKGETIENFVFLEILKNKELFSDEIKTYNKINGSEIDFVYCYKKGGIIPIESKIKNNDILPKIFNGFTKDYANDILFLARTSTSYRSERSIENKKIIILPFWMIGTII